MNTQGVFLNACSSEVLQVDMYRLRPQSRCFLCACPSVYNCSDSSWILGIVGIYAYNPTSWLRCACRFIKMGGSFVKIIPWHAETSQWRSSASSEPCSISAKQPTPARKQGTRLLVQLIQQSLSSSQKRAISFQSGCDPAMLLCKERWGKFS